MITISIVMTSGCTTSTIVKDKASAGTEPNPNPGLVPGKKRSRLNCIVSYECVCVYIYIYTHTQYTHCPLHTLANQILKTKEQ